MLGIAITGMGVINSAGENIDQFYKQLSMPYINLFSENKQPINSLTYPTAFVSSKNFTEPGNKRYDDLTGRLCLTAAQECLEDYLSMNSGGVVDGLVLGTSTGGYHRTKEILSSVLSHYHNQTPIQEKNTFLNQGVMTSATRLIASELNIRGKIMTISNSCNSSALAIVTAISYIKQGRVSSIIAGGGDSLSMPHIMRMKALNLLSSELSKPFSKNRNGLNLGEGAGFLILEPLKSVESENRPYYAEILSYGLSNDPYNIVSPRENGEGVRRAMIEALNRGGLKPSDIDFIVPQGLGTKEHDIAEANAIDSVFPNKPYVSSIKALIGHTLGASGVMNVLAAIYSLRFKKYFPNFNNPTQTMECPVNLLEKELSISSSPFILINSYNLNGSHCSLILSLKEKKDFLYEI